MSFFAARDEDVAAGVNETFCLWNGFVGAAPGHPFLARAVERVTTLILNRADVFDMEREMCQSVGQAVGAWKVRQWPTLLLTGPCALGVAVNDGLGKNDRLSRFDYGWLRTLGVESSGISSDEQDALILKADSNDLGARRFTDIQRNLLVASTDMTDLYRVPLEAVEEDPGQPYGHEPSLSFSTQALYKDMVSKKEQIFLEM
eukprot:CAMPEP_0116547014 /NCGR_PEP_ID=MMETSP0397-20121206/3547_1 /TAXON_ID=216820 /ORGANISM="Cyclophora tenuis, Strain ECT3854" /LENGTH=201 /DNA_ID=CAMNT_0004071509 /DNA_START=100 /DNA_END=705 /DNA_ORIENTATION=+